ncbi:MAG: hydroxylamine reductase [Clostridium perfringens]|nr:hydroxylamine reductase [Clostridium perfringens]
MFCYQCQETAGCSGCTKVGVCGKPADVANLQDLLIYVVKGLSAVAVRGREVGINKREVNKFVVESLFTTITNANFDDEIFVARVRTGLALREFLKKEIEALKGNLENLPEAAIWFGDSVEEMHAKAKLVGVLSTENEDIRSLRELIIYGAKGLSAYLKHAGVLGYHNDEVDGFMQSALAKTLDDSLDIYALVALTVEMGKYGVEGMALLDKANTESYGHPEITKVNIGVRNNPAILISGHDLKDMEELLEQTEGTGVDVYTHSEMLPANYYPAFKKYSHFVGNYGNAWWKQTTEFESFNGPILMTTNCLVPPKDSYKDRVYTTGAVGFKGLKHINLKLDGTKDFSEIIAHAKKCTAPTEIENGEIIGGFAHNQVMQLSNKIVNAIKTGAIKNFFVMAGCDGRAKSRNYYTEFAEKLPKDAVILTAGCAKYKYNKLNLGDINGIPRVLDAGQCNDSYSLVVIALKLAEAFGLDNINDLPLHYNIAWYEQKAVIVLLALLHLGVKNIHLGPTLPAFLSPNVVKVLVDNFGIGGITNVDDDMKMFLEA